MNHTNEEARAIWADQDSMPDVLNQEPQSECTADDFEILPPPSFYQFFADCKTVVTFLESGGELKHRLRLHDLNKSFFSATRNNRKIVGYGETPHEAIWSWACKTKEHDC